MAAENSPSANNLLIPDSGIFVPSKTGFLPEGTIPYQITNLAERQIIEYVSDLEENPRGQRVGRVDLTDRSHKLIDRPKL